MALALESAVPRVYTPAMKIMRYIALAFLLVLCVGTGRPATAPPVPAAAKPAATRQMVLPSHGVMLYGIFYLAAGEGSHPTAIIFHGFPGFEQNLDIAQYLRARGWNVLAMHYRGSWGVKGDFSFEHCAEDADAQVSYMLDPENARKYGIDTRRIIVVGHSMGGYMAASAIAHNKGVAAAVLISAWNIGADYESHHHGGSKVSTIQDEAKSLASDNNLLPLSRTSADALAREIYDHQAALDMNNLAPAIVPRPIFVITANEGLAPVDHAFAAALRKAGDTRVSERHWDTDHSYSGERAALSSAILEWSQENLTR
jgi:uncharacterized protein